jgi:hypothetical protein
MLGQNTPGAPSARGFRLVMAAAISDKGFAKSCFPHDLISLQRQIGDQIKFRAGSTYNVPR